MNPKNPGEKMFRQELHETSSQRDNPHGAWIVYGGQTGSEGKGAIAGYLARKHKWGAAACTFMTNAGHTWIGEDGEKVVVQQLPVSLVSPTVQQLVIGPGSAITLDQLAHELELYDAKYGVERRLRIDPRAIIIDDIHKEIEAEKTKRVASTMKGCGAARADHCLRDPRLRLARDVAWLKPYLTDTAMSLNDVINSGHGVLVEGSQGFDLDINHGIEYPYCTSRGTTPTQTMADLGLDGKLTTRSIAVIRSYPIRVGNVEENGQRVGYSGPMGGKELSWAELTARSGSPENLEERTTVTKKVRRVFELDLDRLKRMSFVTRPTDIALTFADYIDQSIRGLNSEGWARTSFFPEAVRTKIWQIEQAVQRRSAAPRINLIKTGPEDHAIIDWLGRNWGMN